MGQAILNFVHRRRTACVEEDADSASFGGLAIDDDRRQSTVNFNRSERRLTRGQSLLPNVGGDSSILRRKSSTKPIVGGTFEAELKIA